ncbi:hypothetical protein HPHPH34_0441 [Helicobacter pylori Hp H-34]|uniref:Uncharacterized protein n=1 Tax=Helicobacter pylori Hp H-34 TaxID=992069 RepID=I9VSQ4_HELPX|nr:hypothetical protein HPHPH34_0441 [Helicobacter pylori Hp H-34]
MNGGNDLYSPYPLTRFTHFRRCMPIKIIASALISCKNNAMNIFH